MKQMDTLDQLFRRIRNNPDDLDAWKSIMALVDDPQKKRDCQQQIDRITIKQLPVIVCPQCGAGMTVYFDGELHDKRARCSFCGTDLDLPDTYAKTVVEEKTGFGHFLPETSVTTFERRADNQVTSITSEEVEALIMDKGVAAARKELEARGITDFKISSFSGVDQSPEASAILENEGARALAKSHGAIMLNRKQANYFIAAMIALAFVIPLIALIVFLVQAFGK
jgi:hypothetical protein